MSILDYYKQFLDRQSCWVKYKGRQQQTNGNLQKVRLHIALLEKGQIELCVQEIPFPLLPALW
jgi:hypothetical protein